MKRAAPTSLHLLIALTFALSVAISGCGPDAPEAPSNLNAESQDGAIALNWSAGSGGSPSGYNVYRSGGSFQNSSSAQKINDSLVEETSYTDQSAENRETYHYRVTAVAESDGLLGIGGGSAESDPSGEVEKTPFSEPPDRP